MVEVKLGGAVATRIEERYEPNFDARKFFPDWQPSIVQQHKDWLVSNHYDEPSGFAISARHSPATSITWARASCRGSTDSIKRGNR